MSGTTVDICVCTFRRAFLGETLASIGRLSTEGLSVRVIVSDNDTTPSAQAMVEAIAADFPFPITYLHSPAGNISIARNACLGAVTAHYLAFVDDDEVVTPSWLTALVAEARSSEADVVLGPVRAIYQPSAPHWLVAGDFHSTMPVVVDGAITTGYTCNVLMRWQAPFTGLRFDPALGKSGGEDTDFFYRVTDLGGTIRFAPQAWVDEPVPYGREKFSWLLKRRFRSGQTHGARLKGARKVGPMTLALAATKALFCMGAALVTVYSPVTWRRNLLRGTLHVGVVGGSLGTRQAAQYGQPSAS